MVQDSGFLVGGNGGSVTCVQLPYSLPTPPGGGGGRVFEAGGGSLNPRERRAALQSNGIALARELRRAMSPPEVVLWQRLRGGRLAGLKFRRQHPMGRYIADFYCAQALLVVEIDGGSHHGERKAHDETRDARMEANGVMVLRFTAFQVFRKLEVALGTILRWARERTKEPPPS